jgi:hypothetical protein
MSHLVIRSASFRAGRSVLVSYNGVPANGGGAPTSRAVVDGVRCQHGRSVSRLSRMVEPQASETISSHETPTGAGRLTRSGSRRRRKAQSRSTISTPR